MSAKEHYDSLLAELYEWISGDFDQKQNEQLQFFQQHKILPSQNKIAIDLGAGHGLQSIPLAKLGFSVNAIDFSKKLLKDLSLRSKDLDIETIESDILDLDKYFTKAELIVCMGDTLTHLESAELVNSLIQKCFNVLENNGRLILSFRDYGIEPAEAKKIIPVKSDNDRIFTCILDYFDDKVRVTDLLYYKLDEGWQFKLSSYHKLRITTDKVSTFLVQAGFKILSVEMISGMTYLIATK